MGKLNCIIIDCKDADRASESWSQALAGYKVDKQEWGITMKSESDPLVYFEVVPEGKTVKNRLHLNIQAADRPSEVNRLLPSARRRSRRCHPAAATSGRI